MGFVRIICALSMAAVLAAPALLRAGDAATLNVIGSSADGRYLAYEQYGTQDGSGSPYAGIEVVDLETGEPAQPAVNEGGKEGEQRDLATVRRDALARADLANWRIETGRTGTPLVRNLLTDIRADGREVSFSTHPILNGYRADEYSLRLETYRIPTDCWFENHSYAATLTLFDWTRGIVRQFGQRVEPADARTCAMDYRIQEVRLMPGKADHLVVFLDAYRPGFEGHDVRYVVVVGTLE